MTKERIQSVINKLPHSPGRVPYTYHHDYIRMFHDSRDGTLTSRGDVAALSRDTSEEVLYATALVQIVQECPPFDLINIVDKDDVWVIMNCKTIAEAHVAGDF